MPPPYVPIPLEHARFLDEEAKRMGKKWYGPLEDEDEPDAYELLTMPQPSDFPPCDDPCLIPDCPCRYRPKGETA